MKPNNKGWKKAAQGSFEGVPQAGKQRKKKSNEEAALQAQCIKLFRMFWPEHRMRFFAIPNGEKRDLITASNLKRQGVLAGVLDTFLSFPVHPYSGLYIEFKVKVGRLSENQTEFIESVEPHYKTVIVRSSAEFLKEVEGYLKTKKIKF